MLSTELVLALSSAVVLVVIAGLADLNEMFFPRQMLWEHEVGFPLIAKGDWWGNLFLISPAIYIIGKYADGWSNTEIGIALVAGTVVSYWLFQFVYRRGKFADALAGAGEIYPAGWVTMLYSATIVVPIIGLFYLRTNATPQDVLAVGFLLALYVPLANHAVLGWLNSLYAYPWCPRIFAEEKTPLRIIVIGEVLVILATYAKLNISW